MMMIYSFFISRMVEDGVEQTSNMSFHILNTLRLFFLASPKQPTSSLGNSVKFSDIKSMFLSMYVFINI